MSCRSAHSDLITVWRNSKGANWLPALDLNALSLHQFSKYDRRDGFEVDLPAFLGPLLLGDGHQLTGQFTSVWSDCGCRRRACVDTPRLGSPGNIAWRCFRKTGRTANRSSRSSVARPPRLLFLRTHIRRVKLGQKGSEELIADDRHVRSVR